MTCTEIDIEEPRSKREDPFNFWISELTLYKSVLTEEEKGNEGEERKMAPVTCLYSSFMNM
jgi:hypothetical protein